MPRLFLLLSAFLLALLPLGAARAVLPGEQLADPVLEARARDIGRQLRCVVCQNQSIDDSDASLAHDFRMIVRDQLSQGASDEEVIRFMVDRYGDFILLKPPFAWKTAGLWFGPLLVFLAGGLLALRYVRRRRPDTDTGTPPLSPEEEQRLRDMIEKD